MADNAWVQMQWRGVNELMAKAHAAKLNMHLKPFMRREGSEFVREVRTKQLAHQGGAPLADKLTARTGGAGISGSLNYQIEEHGQEVVTRCGVSATSVAAKYAKIHEFGGTIVPRTKNYLRFRTYDGQWHAVKQVDIPARPYLRPAFVERSRNLAFRAHLHLINVFQKAGLL